MALGYICLYYDYEESLDELTDEQIGRVMKAAIRYGKTGVREKLPSSGERVALRFITSNIDRDQKAYDKKCEKAKASAESRYKKDDADADGCERMRTDANACERCQEKEKEEEKENTINSESTRARARDGKREKKPFGKYGNVMLTDEDAAQLRSEHADADEAIEFLSEYIAEDERRGEEYRRKDHAVALRRWVFDAVEERRQKRQNFDGGGLEFDMEDIYEKPPREEQS